MSGTQGLALPQMLYLVAVAVYLGFFLLFLRFLLWKRYADRFYWHRAPRLSSALLHDGADEQRLPLMSILIPARNEADVIEWTVDHMRQLHYPPDRYELVVITDAKEARAADRSRAAAMQGVLLFLKSYVTGKPIPVPPKAPGCSGRDEGLLLALCVHLAVPSPATTRREGRPVTKRMDPGPLRAVPAPVLRYLVWETARRLWADASARAGNEVEPLLRRRLPGETSEGLQVAYAAILSYALPAVAAFALAKGDVHYLRRMRRMVTAAARAHHSLTREVLYGLMDNVATDILARLRREASGPPDLLEQWLSETYREVYPTTQDIMERKVAERATPTGAPRLVHVEVPPDFDGRLGGACVGTEVPSTKGRALNWGLGFIDPQAEWCGFYDAESRPHPDTLMYVARRWLADTDPAGNGSGWRPPGVERPVRIFQGPVFQVRNFFRMGPVCKIACLYQALAHDWYLPALFRRLPFVGGTNLFVQTQLLRRIGGYDPTSLTEDLELGTRAYLECQAWPEYLPMASSEQTPPTFSGFFRQRLRWASGHLQVMDKIRSANQYPAEQRRQLLRQLHRKGQVEWVCYQAATFVPPVMLGLWWGGLVDPEILPNAARWGLNGLSLFYLFFTLYAFVRYSGHLDAATGPAARAWGRAKALAQLLVLPMAAFLFPMPYSGALVLRSLGRSPRTWVKTVRTPE